MTRGSSIPAWLELGLRGSRPFNHHRGAASPSSGFGASSALLMGLGGAGVWFGAFASEAMSDEMASNVIGQPPELIWARLLSMQNHLLDLGDTNLDC